MFLRIRCTPLVISLLYLKARCPSAPSYHMNAPIVQVPEQTWQQLVWRGVFGYLHFICCSSADRSLKQSIKNGEMCRMKKLFLLVVMCCFLPHFHLSSKLVNHVCCCLSFPFGLCQKVYYLLLYWQRKKMTISVKVGTLSGFLFVWINYTVPLLFGSFREVRRMNKECFLTVSQDNLQT